MSPRKKIVPKVLKDLVWDMNIGRERGLGECYVCSQELDSKKFHCGHIISEKNGGKIELNNLRPVCATCNLSIGTRNMDEFRDIYFPVKYRNYYVISIHQKILLKGHNSIYQHNMLPNRKIYNKLTYSFRMLKYIWRHL